MKKHLAMHIQTPLIESFASSTKGCRVWLKLENCQPAGSFKCRGVGNACRKAIEERGKKKLVCSSGGNAGLAVAYSGKLLQVPTSVFVPETTPVYMITRIERMGASVHVVGKVWDETNQEALKMVKEYPNAAYISPFDHPDIWEGNASIITEMKDQMEGLEPDLVVVAVGGGGLLTGVCQGLKRVGWTNTTVLAMETIGANSLQQSVEARQLVTMDSISSVAKSLGALRVAEQALIEALECNVVTGVVSDEEAVESVFRFAEDHQMLVEPACGASLAPMYNTILLSRLLERTTESLQNICVVVCGGNMTKMPFDFSSRRRSTIH